MRFNDVLKRKIVSTDTADTVGKISGFLVDPQRQAVVGLVCKKTSSGSVIPWEGLNAVGEDAVTISDTDKIVAPEGRLAELNDKAHQVLRKRVLASSGDELGHVDDVEFDPATGQVLMLVLDHEEVAGSRLVGVGSYAVVVTAG